MNKTTHNPTTLAVAAALASLNAPKTEKKPTVQYTVDDLANACRDFLYEYDALNDLGTFVKEHPEKEEDVEMDIYECHKEQRRSIASMRRILAQL